MKVVMIPEEKLDQLRDQLCDKIKLKAYESKQFDSEVVGIQAESLQRTLHYYIHKMVDEIKKG